jgi:hypothetical protein
LLDLGALLDETWDGLVLLGPAKAELLQLYGILSDALHLTSLDMLVEETLNRTGPAIDLPSASEPTEVLSIRQAVEMLLASVDRPRHRKALELRYGLTGSRPTRLADIGAALGDSRARADQVVASARTRLARPENTRLLAFLRDLVVRELRALGGTCRWVDLLQRLAAGGQTEGISLEGLVTLVSDLGDAGFHLPSSGAQRLATILPPDEFRRVESAVDLARTSRIATDPEVLIAAVGAAQPDLADAVRACVLALHAPSGPEAGKHGGRERRPTTGLVQAIESVLREAGRPLHYSEVAAALARRLPPGECPDEPLVYTTLHRHGDRFDPRGRGIYALAQDAGRGAVPRRSLGQAGEISLVSIGDKIENTLASAGTALNIDEVVALVVSALHVSPDSVHMAIYQDRQGRFSRVGDRVGLHSWLTGALSGSGVGGSSGFSLSDWGLHRIAQRVEVSLHGESCEPSIRARNTQSEVEKFRELGLGALRSDDL